MIDINELSRGDWVSVRHESQKPEYASRHKIIKIENGLVLVEGFPRHPKAEPLVDAWREIEDFDPIPLTEAIWMRAETFTRQLPLYTEVWVGPLKFRRNNDCFYVCFEGDNGLTNGQPILFVHQLQNLYRTITDEELIFRDLNHAVDKIQK